MKIIKLLILLLVSCSLSAKAGVVKISGSLKQFGLDRPFRFKIEIKTTGLL